MIAVFIKSMHKISSVYPTQKRRNLIYGSIPPAASEKIASEPVKQAPSKPHSSKNKCGVQDDSKISVLLRLELRLVQCRILNTRETVNVLNGNRQSSICEHPEGNKTCTERLVLIIHCRLLNNFLDINLGHRASDGLLECSIHILLDAVCILDNRRVRVFCLGRRD